MGELPPTALGTRSGDSVLSPGSLSVHLTPQLCLSHFSLPSASGLRGMWRQQPWLWGRGSLSLSAPACGSQARIITSPFGLQPSPGWEGSCGHQVPPYRWSKKRLLETQKRWRPAAEALEETHTENFSRTFDSPPRTPQRRAFRSEESLLIIDLRANLLHALFF